MPKIKRFAKIKSFPFKLGADPEFNIVVNDSRLSAIEVITSIFNEYKDKNGQTQEERLVKNAGEIGWDGHSATGELRVIPSKSPQKIIDRLETIFKTFSNKTKVLDLVTLSKYGSVGGHIHLEKPTNIEDISDRTSNTISRLLATFYLPLLMGEDNVNIRSRIKLGYGKMDNYDNISRDNSHTHEFRLPSAEWLTTPKIAQSTLAYMGTIWHEIIKNEKDHQLEKNKIIIPSLESARAYQIMIMSPATSTNFSSYIKEIKKLVRTFEYYPVFKEEIEYIMNHKKVINDKKKAEFNILNGWKMGAPKNISKRELVSQKKINENLKNKNIASLITYLPIHWNKDFNVETFAYELGKRILSLDWKIKNQYFLIGLRKGVKGNIIFSYNNSSKKTYQGVELVKTRNELELFKDYINSLRKKVYNITYENYGTSNNQIISGKLPLIIYGINYQERLDNNISQFLETIIDIEKGKLAETPIPEYESMPNSLPKGEAPGFEIPSKIRGANSEGQQTRMTNNSEDRDNSAVFEETKQEIREEARIKKTEQTPQDQEETNDDYETLTARLPEYVLEEMQEIHEELIVSRPPMININ